MMHMCICKQPVFLHRIRIPKCSSEFCLWGHMSGCVYILDADRESFRSNACMRERRNINRKKELDNMRKRENE